DAKSALLLFHRLYTGGKDIASVLNELSVLARDILIDKTVPESASTLLSNNYDSALLARLGKEQSLNRLLYFTSTLQQTISSLYSSFNRRSDAELFLLRLCDEPFSEDLTALTSRIQRLESRMDVLPAAIQQTRAPQPPRYAPANFSEEECPSAVGAS